MAQPVRVRPFAWWNVAPLLAILIAVWGTFSSANASAAESAWLRGVVRLNVRTGPGTQYRITGGLKTGDHVEIQQRLESWVEVGLDDGASGWIPTGYLEPGPPALLRLKIVEEEAALLREASADQIRQLAELKELNQVLELVGKEGQREIDQLRGDNALLRANTRWPEWLTGAAILLAGMLLGAIWQRALSRRRTSRIRL